MPTTESKKRPATVLSGDQDEHESGAKRTATLPLSAGRSFFGSVSVDCALSSMLRGHASALHVMDTPAVGDSRMLILADTLDRNNSSLKALCLGTFDCRGRARRGVMSLAVAPCCQEDGNSLELLRLVLQNMRELTIFLNNQVNEGIGTISSLVKVLKGNRTLQYFSLICNFLDDDSIVEITQLLQDNESSLKFVKLQCNGLFFVSPRGYQALIETLENNTVLESVQLLRCSEDDPLQEQGEDHDMALAEKAAREEDEAVIEYYLDLNKSGVRNLHLHSDTAPSYFLTKMISHREELNTVFYMLSANPSFVAYGTDQNLGSVVMEGMKDVSTR